MRADGALHEREIRVDVAHDFVRWMRLHPGCEVTEVAEEDRHLAHLPAEAHAPGENLVPHLWADVFAEGLADALALPQTGHHAIEAFGHRADLVVAHDGRARREIAAADALHRGLDVAQWLGDTARDEQREAGGGDRSHAEQEDDHREHVAEERRRDVTVGADHE